VVVGLVGVSRDITEFKKALQGIVTAKEAAERASRLKDYFIANMSHEIRTPLNAIIGFTELLREEVSDVLPETAERYFPIISSAGIRLVRTIDMILNLAKLQSGMYAVNRQSIDLDQVIRNLVGETSLEARKRGLELSYEKASTETTVLTDEYCIVQSVSNLVDNALKYTSKGFVRVRLYQKNPGSVCIEVKDSGIGMNSDYLNRLFEPFTQEDTSFTRAYEGIGLGLSITKRMIEAIGGIISVTSTKSVGSTFTIELLQDTEQA
jgi:signal transduction histidine kinase